mgnify:CR=1 FL=1
MTSISPRFPDLELDLAFNGASDGFWIGPLDAATKFRLTEADPWHKDLSTWLQVVRNDMSLICPEAVRQAPALSLGLLLTDDATIAEINAIWGKSSVVTDVLSFPAFEETIVRPEEQHLELGDIVISVPTAQRQARDHNHDLEKELRWLVSHGFLHLLGWEHPNPKDLNQMLNLQEQLLNIDGMVQFGSKKP